MMRVTRVMRMTRVMILFEVTVGNWRLSLFELRLFELLEAGGLRLRLFVVVR